MVGRRLIRLPYHDATRKTRKTGKRVALKGKYLFTKEDILKVTLAQDLEKGTEKKKTEK
jgi:hypothetical protein